MTALQPVSIVTDPILVSSYEGYPKYDNSAVIDWQTYFDEEIVLFDPRYPLYDTSVVIDWYTYFEEPITAFVPPSTSIAQIHQLSSPDVQTTESEVQTTQLAQDYTFTCYSITTGEVLFSTTSLTQVHDLTGDKTRTAPPVVSDSSLTQDHDLQSNSVTSAQPLVSDAPVTEAETLVAPSVVTGTPDVGIISLTQVYNLSPDSTTTPFPDLGEPVNPDAVVAQETKEIEQMFGGWPRRAYEVPDGRLVQAEREIEATYGDRVSIDRKAKSLVKFGRSAELGTTALETVWTVGGDEVYVTDNTISYISSSSASDTQQITIEGHTVDANGDFTFLVQTVTLDGQNAVALDTDVARVSRAYNSDSTELVGRVVVYENTTVVGGVPTDETKIHIDIPQGFQQSFKAATTFSSEDYYLMTGFYGAVSAKQAGSVDFYVEIRDKGKVFLPKGCFTASSTGGAADISLDPAILVPKNADVRIRCETENNNVVVFGIFKGYLAKVLG